MGCESRAELRRLCVQDKAAESCGLRNLYFGTNGSSSSSSSSGKRELVRHEALIVRVKASLHTSTTTITITTITII